LVSEFPRIPLCDFNVVKLYNLETDNSLLLSYLYASCYNITHMKVQLLQQILVTIIYSILRSRSLIAHKTHVTDFNFFVVIM